MNSAHTREAVDRRERVADKSVWMTIFEDYGVRPGSSDIAKNESYDVKEGCRKCKRMKSLGTKTRRPRTPLLLKEKRSQLR